MPKALSAVIIGGAVALLALGAYVVISNEPQLVFPLAPQCAVGIAGTNASITVKGWDSSGACAQIAAGGASAGAYVKESAASGTLICRGPLKGDVSDTVTVRDTGLLDAVGHTLCSILVVLPSPQPSAGLD